MVFQDPMSSLDPVYRVGHQIVEQIRVHDRKVSKAQAIDRAVELMERVGIPRAARSPAVLPARVLRRHAPARDDRDGAVVLAEAADRRRADDRARRDDPGADPRRAAPAARRDRRRRSSSSPTTSASSPTSPTGWSSCTSGRVVEQGTLDDIFYDPQHPYTWGLLGSITRVDADRSQRLPAIPGMPPSLLRPPQGVPLPAALPARLRRAAREVPELEAHTPDRPEHLDRCWLDGRAEAPAAPGRRPDRARRR